MPLVLKHFIKIYGRVVYKSPHENDLLGRLKSGWGILKKVAEKSAAASAKVAEDKISPLGYCTPSASSTAAAEKLGATHRLVYIRNTNWTPAKGEKIEINSKIYNVLSIEQVLYGSSTLFYNDVLLSEATS